MTSKVFKTISFLALLLLPLGTVCAQKMKAVDLGLSVKWAPCNVGASAPEQYGDYFAWGETAVKEDYSWKTLKFCGDAAGNSFSKYNSKENYGPVDNLVQLDLSDDAAHVKMRGKWRIPTSEEWKELHEKCKWEWTEVNGVKGYNVTGPSGKSIFLPTGGLKSNTSSVNVGVIGDYWTATLCTRSPYSGCNIYFNSRGIYTDEDSYRHYGLTIRAVSPK